MEGWLREPVEHVRDVRSQLLTKLALLDRTGADPRELLRRPREVLVPITAAGRQSASARRASTRS